jgi:CubicO group peptidase (beta-lactamase class C family)
MGNLVMYDDSTGGPWDARDNMTSADYQTRFNTLYPQGLRPVRVSGKGLGANARFSAIFATREDSDARTLRMSGSPAMATIDNAMVAVMTANMLRGALLAIVQGTRLVYARGYTLAEAGYPDVQPTTFFRQASVSKMFTAAAIYQLVDQQVKLPGGAVVTLDTHLKDALPGIANGPPVAHWNDITIRHLLEMTSGVTTGILGTDPNVSATLPVSALAMAQWLYRQALANTPGDTTKGTYSNAAYMLLGLVVAQMRGAPNYLAGLKTGLLDPLHITRVRSAVTVASGNAGDEARYHSRPLTTQQSVMVTGQPLCALGYGEWNLENCGGGGGISAAATDVARVLAAFSVSNNNPMMRVATLQSWMANAAHATATITGPAGHGYHGFDDVFTVDAANHLFAGDKGGSLTTSQNGVHFETGGISTVICWNGMTPTGPAWFSPYAAVTDAARAHDWGTTDLFPSFGMPAFPVRIPRPPPHPIPPRSVPIPSHMLPRVGLPKNM